MMGLIIVGVVLSLLGVLPVGVVYFYIWNLRRHPQVSREYLTIPAHERLLRIVRPEQDSRYEYRVSGVVTLTPREDGTYAGDDIPDYTFDVCHLYDMKTLELYEQGKKLPEGRYNCARRTIDFYTYMQTGLGLDFALVLINPHAYDLPLHFRLDYYPTPRWVGRVARAAMPGRVLALVGLALLAVGGIRWLL